MLSTQFNIFFIPFLMLHSTIHSEVLLQEQKVHGLFFLIRYYLNFDFHLVETLLIK